MGRAAQVLDSFTVIVGEKRGRPKRTLQVEHAPRVTIEHPENLELTSIISRLRRQDPASKAQHAQLGQKISNYVLLKSWEEARDTAIQTIQTLSANQNALKLDHIMSLQPDNRMRSRVARALQKTINKDALPQPEELEEIGKGLAQTSLSHAVAQDIGSLKRLPLDEIEDSLRSFLGDNIYNYLYRDFSKRQLELAHYPWPDPNIRIVDMLTSSALWKRMIQLQSKDKSDIALRAEMARSCRRMAGYASKSDRKIASR